MPTNLQPMNGLQCSEVRGSPVRRPNAGRHSRSFCFSHSLLRYPTESIVVLTRNQGQKEARNNSQHSTYPMSTYTATPCTKTWGGQKRRLKGDGFASLTTSVSLPGGQNLL
ncbi:hypothetical protein VTK73DRAFT_3758 [Phialemonium thermophilum]|uniref:Uncharacterized protein n=1 Tax=Phialemonium thermophilum TaxID=223376 RepID=A0ABR3VFQ4_9PEZI